MSSLVSKMAPILTTAGSEARLVSTATQNNNNNRKSKQAEKDDDEDDNDDDADDNDADDEDDENVDDIEVWRREQPSCGNPGLMDGNTAGEDDVAWRGVNELPAPNIDVVAWRDVEDISRRGVDGVG